MSAARDVRALRRCTCWLSAGSFFVLDALRQGRAAQADHALRRRGASPSSTGTPAPTRGRRSRATPRPTSCVWAMRASVLALAAVWLVRTYRKERLFVREAAGGAVEDRASSRSARSPHGGRCGAGEPEVTFEPEGKRVVVQAGRHAARGGRGQRPADRGRLPDGRLRRRPGRDHGRHGEPVGRSSDDERTTLDRLGLAANTRMACCARVQGPVDGLADAGARPTASDARSQIAGFAYDRAIERVVVIGNGIAGVTAADHVRRRHPECAIHLVGRRARTTSTTAWAISRLIYGRSAMQGLYLQPGRVVRGARRSRRG